MTTSEYKATKCPHCGASMKMYWHKMTPILVDALIKFRSAVVDKNENSVHLIKDMDGKPYELAPYEWKNWTKLRFHGLVAKYKIKNSDGKMVWKRGYWLLTARGASFLRGDLAVPGSVQTFRNRVTDHDYERMVTVKDVKGEVPYLETISDIQYEVATPKDVAQATLGI